MRTKPKSHPRGLEVEFWFDFSSAYAYFASLELEFEDVAP